MENVPLKLKENWDAVMGWKDTYDSTTSPIYIQNDSYFKIKDFLTRRERGSLIVSGERGAGKTTTVMTLLKDLKEIVFPVYINALHLESLGKDSQSFLNTMEIIKELMSQFDHEMKRRSLPQDKKLKNLLTIINATTFIKKEYISSEGAIGAESNMSAGVNNSIIAAKLAISSSLKESFKDEELLVKAGYSIEDYSRELSQIITDFELRQQNQEVKNFNLNIINKLAINVVLQKTSKEVRKNLKIVFIIDELDYYDSTKKNKPGPKEVLDSIKKLKNLFTLSGAHFIFITGRNTYRHAIDREDDYNTLFTERVFVTKPDGAELIRYLNEIVDTKEEKEKIEIFKWLLIDKSDHNYFELTQSIKARQKIDNGKPILTTEFSDTEEKLALVHIAMNTIYMYFMKIALFEHHSELLFNELSLVKDNFDAWIHGQGLLPIKLPIEADGDISPQLKSKATDAKLSFIRYLFRLSESEVPSILSDPSQEIQPPWDNLKLKLELTSVKKGILGPVTDDELKVIELSKQIIENINNKLRLLNLKPITDFKDAINMLSESLFYEVEDGVVDVITKAMNSINEDLFFDRDPNITQNAYEHLKRITQTLESVFVVSDNNLFKVESGDLIKIKNGIQLKSNAKAFLIEESNSLLGDFEVRYTVKLQPESLLNFTTFTDIDNPPQDRYFMFRLDARGANEHVGNGILLKDKGAERWGGYIDNLGEKREASQANTNLKIKVVFRKNTAIFSIKKRTEGNYLRIASIDNISKPIRLGFLLERGEAEVTEFVIS